MLDRIIKFSLNNRLLVLAITALCIVWGSKVITELPIDVFPDLNRPTVTVMAEAGGLAPEEVETLISTPLETAMNGLPGVSRVRSASGVGLSIVWIEFEWGTDLLVNRQLVSEKLQTVDNMLPQNVVPVMGPISSLLGEIMLVGLHSDTIAPMEVRSFADWTIRPRLQAISGVAQIVPIGGGVMQVQIQVNPSKLREHNLTLDDVKKAAADIGLNTSGGFLEGNHQEYLIRNIARPQSIEEIAATPIVRREGVIISLKDVAQVTYAPQVMRGDASISTKPGVIMAIQKQPGANTVTLTRQIEAEIATLRHTVPEGIQIQELFKQATFIEAAIGNVEEALRDGSICVAIVLFLFLMNFRTTAITLTAIPLSLLITFLVLHWFGISINTMTLGGLAVAIGELVDDAIVDVENVFRRLRENRLLETPRSALTVIYEASSEVRNSIVIATLIVVLVFIPLFSMDGLEGRLFIPLGIAYVVSILASLLVSLTVTPVLCSLLLSKSKSKSHDHEKDGAFVRWLKRIDSSILEKILDKPRTIIIACLTLVLLAVSSTLLMGKEFLPPFNEGTVTAFVVTPPGTSLSESNRIATIAEKELLKIKGIHATGRRTGRAEQDEHAEGVYNSEIDVDLSSAGQDRDEILGKMRAALKNIPGIGISLGQPISHRLDHMLSGVKAQIAIKIFGDDLATLRALAAEVKGKIANVPGLVDLDVEKVTLIPQVQIIPDTLKAARYGFTPGYISRWLEDALSGHDVSEILQGQRRIAVNIRLDNAVKNEIHTLENLMIDGPDDLRIPLHAISQVQLTTGPNAINHENGRRRIVVMANTQGRDLGSVVDDVQAILASNVKLPEGYSYTLGGQFESQKSATKAIAALSLLSLVGVFLVLFINFKSAMIAGQIMINIPLALIGSVIAVFLTGGVFSVGTLVGFVALCGIASRNGIMMISHYLHLMQHEGHVFDRAMVIKGSLERLVPVMMTALTASLALIPIAMAAGEPGKEILHPVAVVILGGLMSSTLLDIFVTPVIFYNYGRKAVAKLLDAKTTATTQSDDDRRAS